MPKDTPSIAKNKIRRCLVAICDRHPSISEVRRLWEYFGSCCAYCGSTIQPDSRTGHLDHLISFTDGGSNNIHHQVLSCAKCNGDEKREEPWESFLVRKAGKSSFFTSRKLKIEKWIACAPKTDKNKELTKEIETIIQEAIGNFECSVKKMKELRSKST